MRLAAVLLTALSAAAAAAASPATPPAAAAAPADGWRADRGVRFEFPARFQVERTLEQEPGEENDVVFVGKKGALELRAEVEQGTLACTAQALAGAPRQLEVGGRPACEVELPAPPVLDPKAGARRAHALLVQFPGRFLSVLAFAPDQATASKLARQLAATAREE